MVVVFTGADNYQWKTLSDKYIIPSVSDDYPLPPDETAQLLLKNVIRDLENPVPQRPHPLPDIANKISGKKYILEKNDLNFTSITLWFEKDNESRLLINYNKNELDMAVGLDNIYRIAQGMSWGMKPDNNILALKGEWKDEKRFTIDFQEVGEPFYFDIELTFDEEEIRPLFIWQPFNMKFPLKGKL
jgi:hypothetical protein